MKPWDLPAIWVVVEKKGKGKIQFPEYFQAGTKRNSVINQNLIFIKQSPRIGCVFRGKTIKMGHQLPGFLNES